MLQAALAFTRKLDKLPLPCRSAPGFVVNRILMPYLNEAMFAAEEGVALAHIDDVAVDLACRWARSSSPTPSASTCACTSARSSRQAFGRESAWHRAQSWCDAKQLGRKSGRGFYEWRDGKADQTRE